MILRSYNSSYGTNIEEQEFVPGASVKKLEEKEKKSL